MRIKVAHNQVRGGVQVRQVMKASVAENEIIIRTENPVDPGIGLNAGSADKNASRQNENSFQGFRREPLSGVRRQKPVS